MMYSKKELKNYLKEILKEKQDVSSFSFEYQNGHQEFHARLRINVSVDKIVQWKIPRKTSLDLEEELKVAKTKEIGFSKEKMFSFINDLTKKKIWDLENCTDRALPDTALLIFRIRNEGELIFKREAWETCRNDSKRVKEIIRAIEANLPTDWTPP